MEQRVSLVTLGVADLARAGAFYRALGWTDQSPPGADVLFFQAGGMVLGLWGREQLSADSGVVDSGGFAGVALAHNVGSPDEVDAVLAEAKRAGATVTRTAGDTPWGGYSGLHRPQRPPLGSCPQPVLDAARRRLCEPAGVTPGERRRRCRWLDSGHPPT